MSEKILLLLMELFAIAGRGSAEDEKVRRSMESQFLKLTLTEDKAQEFLGFYDSCIQKYHPDNTPSIEAEQLRTNQSLDICTELNQVLSQKQRIVVIVRLSEYIYIAKSQSEREVSFLRLVRNALKIDAAEFEILHSLVTSDEVQHGQLSLTISNIDTAHDNQNHLHQPDLEGEIWVTRIPSTDTYCFRYKGPQKLTLNGIEIQPGVVQFLDSGGIIRGDGMTPIYYSDVASSFLDNELKHSLEYRCEGLEFQFPNGKIGLHEINFCDTEGRLVAIMGGSGAGKSTLLNVLNGKAKPSKGEIKINGVNLHENAKELEGVIGFVSQSDILIEDLSVFQNLYFNSQLCFSELDNEAIEHKVNTLLKDIGLYEIRDLKVGSPLEKVISGGQRKRLNIALELIREPSVLFLDEPTSGLSSSDSEMVLDLLKSLTYKGKLVYVVIHQPSSQIFKLFDKLLLLDQGGYPIYQGNPVDAVLYFKHATHRINPDAGECACCGNVNPEQIFNIIEARHLDDAGHATGERRFSSIHWHKHYREHIDQTLPSSNSKGEVAGGDYKKAGLVKQFAVFVKRDILAKLNNTQYLVITLLEAPVLAILLAYLSRFQVPGQPYTFQDNRNIVAYVFMSVIVMLFLGLMTSAEEIFRDRKILERERFLNLSKLAYLKSKIFILLIISAIQAFLFVFIGNSILGFSGMYFEFWLMLFSVSVLANGLGLNVSSAFKSAVTIYILIPFLIIPQLLLSGLLVRFDELNPGLSSRSVVPVAGELMPTRWAFEALTVNLFVNSEYEQLFYDLKKEKVRIGYYRNSWYPELQKLVQMAPSEHTDSTLSLLNIEFAKAGLKSEYATKESLESGTSANKLELLRKRFNASINKTEDALDNRLKSITEGDASIDLVELRSRTYNDRIAELVLNQNFLGPRIFYENGAFHPSQNNAYFDPALDRQIRTHFYAPKKHFMGKYYETFWVNLLVIICFTIGLYLLLYFAVLERLIKRLGRINFKRKALH